MVSPRREIAVILLGFALPACGIVVGLGDERVLDRRVDGGAEAPEPDAPAGDVPGNDRPSVEVDGDEGPESDAPPLPVDARAVVGRLVHATRGSCLGVLVGPATVLTAASCFPEHARRCDTESPTGWTFEVGGRTGTVDGLALPPGVDLAEDRSSGSMCRVDCSADREILRQTIRRGRDLALVHLARPLGPRAAVLTRTDDATTGLAGVHLALDRDRPGLGGAVTFGELGIGEPQMRTLVPEWPFAIAEHERSCGSFDRGTALGPQVLWKKTSPATDPTHQPWFNDFAIRLSRSGGPSDAPLGDRRGAPITLEHGERTIVVGIVVDGHRNWEVAAPTFAPEVGAWLEARLVDFDDDCIPDATDRQPARAARLGTCPAPLAAGWSETAVIANGSGGRGLADAPAITSWGPGRLDIYTSVFDDGVHHLPCEGSCVAWEPSFGGQLQGGIAAATWGVGHQYYAVVGWDRTVHGRSFDDRYDDAWDRSYQESFGTVQGTPAAAAVATDALEVWFRRGGRLHRARGTTMRHWQVEDTGVAAAGDPAVARSLAGDVHVLAPDGHGNWIHLQLAPSAAVSSAKQTLHAVGLHTAPAIAVARDDRLDVFVRGPTSQLRWGAVVLGSTPTVAPFVDVGGVITSHPGATSSDRGHLEVVARGPNGELRLFRHRIADATR
jgi:hypothetical protein